LVFECEDFHTKA